MYYVQFLIKLCYVILVCLLLLLYVLAADQNVSEYDQVMPQPQTAPKASRERHSTTCADPEGGGDKGSGPPPPLKNHKNIGFSRNTGPDPLKNRNYQASIQCWAIISTPAKRHLIAFRWRADNGPLIVVLGSSLSPHQLKKKLSKLTPSDKTVWIRACTIQSKKPAPSSSAR